LRRRALFPEKNCSSTQRCQTCYVECRHARQSRANGSSGEHENEKASETDRIGAYGHRASPGTKHRQQQEDSEHGE
jgi:hypothetical protein